MAAPELEEIRHAAERARSLTSQLLAFSRKQMLQMVPVDVNAVIERDARLIGRLIGEHISLRLDLAPLGRPVRGDVAQLGQVLMNLAVNARDAMPNGGELLLETRLTSVGTDTSAPSALAEGEYVQLRVKDTGLGIRRDLLPHIFEPFFTTKDVAQGSGLGLATVYGIVKQFGGDIRVVSAEGEGTEFTIFLPVEDTGVVATESGPVPIERHPTGTERILLVEDESAVRELVRRVLQRRGYQVVAASSGEEALDIASNGDFTADLLLTDAVMPGISGPTLAMTLTKRHPRLRVLIMSGFTEHPMLADGAERFRLLSKPFRPDDLLRTVREQLDA
jgi:CheY-like chemotaxis protein